MNEPIETTPIEPTQNALLEPPEETVGDIMHKMADNGLKFIVIVGGMIAYLVGIVYAEVHGLTMLMKGVAPEYQIWAMAGMVVAGMSAILFPLALKSWAIESRHRIVCFLFYAADFVFLAFNAFVDFDVNTGGTLTGWQAMYASYILPASPVILTAMWGILFQLDPAVKQKVLLLTVRAAMQEKLARGVANAAKGQNVQAVVNAAAEREVERALTELFGAPVVMYKMHRTDNLPPARDGWLNRFFGRLSRQGQSINSTATPSQSEPSDLSNSQNQQDGGKPSQ
jgi:hypothetical protein